MVQQTQLELLPFCLLNSPVVKLEDRAVLAFNMLTVVSEKLAVLAQQKHGEMKPA